MATATGRNRCVMCEKDKATLRCGGCLQEFCFNHSTDHRQELSRQLDEIEVTRDLFRQTLTEQIDDPTKHTLIQKINKWERDSIEKIRQTAEQTRQRLLKHTTKYINRIEADLNKLTGQLRQSREENDFYETDLRHWSEELTRLSTELTEPLNINLRYNTTSPLISEISVSVKSISPCSAKIDANTKWMQNGITVAGGNRKGPELNQLHSPYGLYFDHDQTIYVADYNNHRVVQWKHGDTSGQVVAGGNGSGDRHDQLNGPTDVFVDKDSDSFIICDYGNRRVVRWPRRHGAHGETIISNIDCWGLSMDNDGYFYISDYEKHEVRRWKTGDMNGVVVAGGNGRGDRLDQLDYPTYTFVDDNGSVYVTDWNNHRVTQWTKDAKEGVVVAGGQGEGNGLTQLSTPFGLIADESGAVYVSDCNNHRIVRWLQGATEGTIVVGGNDQGVQSNQLNKPVCVSFDGQGNLYVADYSNHRIQQFHIESSSNA